MEIKVKTLTGKEIEIEIDPMDTIAQIKDRIEEREGIPPLQQRIVYTGKQLADDETAKHYNIEEIDDKIQILEEEHDSVDLLTPLGKRIPKKRSVKLSTKAKEMQLHFESAPRGNRGHGKGGCG